MFNSVVSVAIALGITLGSALGTVGEPPRVAFSSDGASTSVVTTEQAASGTDPVVLDETLNPKNYEITINIAGDVEIAAYKGYVAKNNFADYANKKDPSYFLAGVQQYFANDDLTVVNLENVLTDRPLSAIGKGPGPAYWYKAPTSNMRILTAGSVEAVSLANNHTGDYGEAGRQDTIAAVQAYGVEYGNDSRTFYYEKNGYTVAFICNGMWGEYQANTIIKLIQEASKYSDFQVVFYHGGTERVHAPEQWRVRASHALVDAGADLVIGNHPHVIQPRENYNGVDIIYSMGNFCFGDERRAENRTIIYNLKLTVDKDGNLVSKVGTIVPCYVYTGNYNYFDPTVIEDPATKQRVLDFMNWKRSSPL